MLLRPQAPMRPLALLLLLLPLAAAGQLTETFADGDFTDDPAWTGDTDRFAVVPFEGDFALRSDGLAESDTLALATPSRFGFGRWRFRFRYEDNLTTGKGTRVYLLADTDALKGDVRGYYVQIGTNNSDEIRLYRQDGPPDARTELGDGLPDLVTGDAGDVVVEVTRDGSGTWVVTANPDAGGPSFIASDLTYTRSDSFGLWLKHTTASGQAFFWDDVLASATGDTTPPVAEAVQVGRPGVLRVQFSEQIGGDTIAPTDFVVPGVGSPEVAEQDNFDGIVLVFPEPFALGSYTLEIDGLADNAGNPLAPTSLPFEIDADPPVLVQAEASSPTTVEVLFNEPVANIDDLTLYEITPDIGRPVGIDIIPLNTPVPGTQLILGTPLMDGTLYTITARGARDPLGNVQPETSASFFFGTPAAPEPGDVVVNELMYDPPTGGSDEYVELLNLSEAAFDLSAFVLADATGEARVTEAPTVLPPGAYAVLVRDSLAFAAAFPDVPAGAVVREVAGWRALNNSGDDVALLYQPTNDDPSVEIDRVSYLPGWGGADAALERIDPAGPSGFASNFATTTDTRGGTPGAENSVFAPDVTPPALLGATATSATTVLVRFDEPLDPASAATAGNYAISGGVGTPAAVGLAPEGDPSEVLLTLAAPLAGPQTYTLTVRGVADLRGNALMEATTPFFFGVGDTPEPGDLVVNEIMYDPPAGGSGEYVEVFNRTTDKAFDLRQLALDDASVGPTPITDLPVFVEPGGYAVIVQNASGFTDVFGRLDSAVEQGGWGALNNTGDTVVLSFLESDGAVVLDSVAYLPSWGGDGVALERKDPAGLSQSRGNFASSIAPAGGTPGAQNSVFERDTFGPQPLEGEVADDERSLFVIYDEPLDPDFVTPERVSVAADGAPVPALTEIGVTLGSSVPTLTLGFADRLPGGPLTFTATGFRDLLGNETPTATLIIPFEPDRTPPSVTSAAIVDATTIEVGFSELVPAATALDAARYAVSGGVGAPERVVYAPGQIGTAVLLTFAVPFEERRLYTLTVEGLADRSGNVSAAQETLLFFGETDAPAIGDIVVNEIMFDPLAGADGEYVELLNRTAKTFDLQRFVLSDSSPRPGGDGDPENDPISAAPLILPPEGLVVLAADPDTVRAVFGVVPGLVAADGFPGLNNSEDAVVLTFLSDGGAAVTIDSAFYRDDWHRPELRETDGVALERIAPDGPSSQSSTWSSSLAPAGGTPGAPNSVFVDPEQEPPGDAGLAIDSPFAPDEGQSARIQYTLSTDAALVRVRVFDGAGRLVRTLEAGDLVGRTGFLDWDGRDDAGRRLRVGIYVVLLEALDAQGGKTEAFKDVAVLARRF